MKRMMFLGALVLGVTVCSQSFGFELLDRMIEKVYLLPEDAAIARVSDTQGLGGAA